MINLAYAHGGAEHAAASTASWSAWTLDPLVLVPLALAGALYGAGLRSSWRRAGIGRGVKGWEAAAFAGGMLALFAALVSPLDALGERLFSAHMVQHLVLMNIAAPLLVLGAPLQAIARPLPRAWQRALAGLVRSRGWSWLTGAAFAMVLQQIMLWSWHAPRAVALSLGSDAVHIAMHASLLAAALFFWTATLRPQAGHYWASIAALLATLKVSGLISIVLLLRPGAHYLAYGDNARAWGLSAAGDEQLGWGFMMIVGTPTYLIAALALFSLAFARLHTAGPRLIEGASPQ